MKIERCGGKWVVVDGPGPSAGRWRLEGDRVLLGRACGREREVPRDEVPLEIALALVASRDAARFADNHPGQLLYGPAALSRWRAALREALVRAQVQAGGTLASWQAFRNAFEAVIIAANTDSQP